VRGRLNRRQYERHLCEEKNDSDISELNRTAGSRPFEAQGYLLKIIKASLKVSKATDGAYDITLLPQGQLSENAARANKLPSKARVNAVLSAVGY